MAGQLRHKKQLSKRGRCIAILPGQYYDAETGLHYNWHRYYDPETGRYLTPDPIGLAGGINPFLYAEANPINNIDPLGLQTAVMPGSPGLPIGPLPGTVLEPGSHANDLFVRDITSIIGLMDPRPLINDIINFWNESTEDGEACPTENNDEKGQRGNPFKGEPGTWSEHPHGKQDRFYGPDGTPLIDIDYGHDHGQGQPHVHPWKDGVRGPGYPL